MNMLPSSSYFPMSSSPSSLSSLPSVALKTAAVAALLILESATVIGDRDLPQLSYLPPTPGASKRPPPGSTSVPALFPPTLPPPASPSQSPPSLSVVIPFPDDAPSLLTSPGSGVIPFPPSPPSLGSLGDESAAAAGDPGTLQAFPDPSLGCSEACTKIYEPLCGTNGVTYNNKCLFDIAICKGSASGISLDVAHEGTCETLSLTIESNIRESSLPSTSSASSSVMTCDKECTKIFNPVCGSDGNSYNNICLLEVASCESLSAGGEAVVFSYEGQCVPSDTALFIAATITNDPETSSAGIIGSSFHGAVGDAHRNTHEGGVAAQASSSSPCPEACNEIFTPVCGTDGQTYNNECLLDVAACKSRSVAGIVLFKDFDGPCVAVLPRGPACDEVCVKTFLPVCGSDGETYNNICLLNLANCLNPFVTITYVSDGHCESKSAAGLSSDPRPILSTDRRPPPEVVLTPTAAGQNVKIPAAPERSYLAPM